MRAQLTPSGRGKRQGSGTEPAEVNPDPSASTYHRTPAERRRSMTLAQRLKRVFGIDVNSCVHCGGSVRIVASIEDPHVIRAILDHFEKHGALEQAHYCPAPRAPPAAAA